MNMRWNSSKFRLYSSKICSSKIHEIQANSGFIQVKSVQVKSMSKIRLYSSKICSSKSHEIQAKSGGTAFAQQLAQASALNAADLVHERDLKKQKIEFGPAALFGTAAPAKMKQTVPDSPVPARGAMQRLERAQPVSSLITASSGRNFTSVISRYSSWIYIVNSFMILWWWI